MAPIQAMAKYKFTYAQRYAVWKHHGSRCYWCDEPLGIMDTTIDHFIPEHLENKATELDKVRADYALSPSFIINDYCNWLPSHARCNSVGKGANLPKLTFQAIATLDRLARDAEVVRSIEHGIKSKIKADKRFAQVMVGLQTGVQADAFTKEQKEEMKALLADPELEHDEDILLLRKEIYLDVEQHYVDFLNRKPDPNSLAFWSNQISEERSSAAENANVLVNVSSAFFLSTEFYDTGYLVYRMYKAAFGSASGASTLGGKHQLSVPIIRLSEFVPAIQQIGHGVVEGKGDWQSKLENNKAKFMSEFVSRSRFILAYPTSMTAAQFVDSLNTNAGNPLTSAKRDQLVNDLGTGVKARAQILRSVAEDPNLINAEFSRAFVLMQYFGYLRRDPNNTPNTDFSGYEFWLKKLNEFDGDYVAAEMVKAFITSDEYRERFGASSDTEPHNGQTFSKVLNL